MTVDQARELAEAHLSAALPSRWRHVQAVAQRADILAQRVLAPRETVVAAAWLHDIGYSPTIAQSGFHPLDGARYLRTLGWSAPVCGLVAFHTCARVEARRRGLEVAITREFIDSPGLARDVLWSADATVGPEGQSLNLDNRIAEIAQRYGPDHLVSQCMGEIRSELLAAITRVRSIAVVRGRGQAA